MTRAYLPTLTVEADIGVDATYGYYDNDLYDNANAKYAPSGVGTSAFGVDLVSRLRDEGFTIRRGASNPNPTGIVAQAGTFSCVLNNRDRELDPLNTSGTYSLGGVSHVQPGCWVLIQATWDGTTYDLFGGYADGWPQTYPAFGKDQTVQLAATDAVKKLANTVVDIDRDPEYTGARIDAIVAAAEHPEITADVGVARVRSLTQQSNAWSLMADVTTAEWGDLYVTGLGDVTFKQRASRSATSAATFGDGVGELPFVDVVVAYDTDLVINDAILTYTDDDNRVTNADGASIGKYGKRTWNAQVPLTSERVAEQYLGWLLYRYRFPQLRIDQIQVRPAADPDNLWPVVLDLDIADRVTVKLTPQGGGSRVDRDMFIVGITHDYRAGDWVTTYVLEDAEWMNTIGVYDTSTYDTGSPVYGF